MHFHVVWALSWGSEDPETPMWQELKDQALGIDRGENANANEVDRPDISQEVQLILGLLDQQFQLLEREEDLFSDRLPAPILTEWIHARNIATEFFPQFLDGLIEFSREIGDDATISRIHDATARTQTITRALDLYTQSFRESLNNLQAELEAAEVNDDEPLIELSADSAASHFILGTLAGIFGTLLLVGLAILIYVLSKQRGNRAPMGGS